MPSIIESITPNALVANTANQGIAKQEDTRENTSFLDIITQSSQSSVINSANNSNEEDINLSLQNQENHTSEAKEALTVYNLPLLHYENTINKTAENTKLEKLEDVKNNSKEETLLQNCNENKIATFLGIDASNANNLKNLESATILSSFSKNNTNIDDQPLDKSTQTAKTLLDIDDHYTKKTYAEHFVNLGDHYNFSENYNNYNNHFNLKFAQLSFNMQKIDESEQFEKTLSHIQTYIKTEKSSSRNSIKIALYPENLGSIEIDSNIDNLGMQTVKITATKLSTLLMLQSNQGVLIDGLKKIGFLPQLCTLSFLFNKNLNDTQKNQLDSKKKSTLFNQTNTESKGIRDFYTENGYKFINLNLEEFRNTINTLA